MKEQIIVKSTDINQYLSALSNEERIETLKYLQDSGTLGNPILESLFQAQVDSEQTLKQLQLKSNEIKQDTNEWFQSVEKRLEASAEEYFNSLSEFVGEQSALFSRSKEDMEATMLNLPQHIIQSVRDLIEHEEKQFKERLQVAEFEWTMRIKAMSEEERNKATAALEKTLKSKLQGAVEVVFRQSLDKFKFLVILRDIGVVLVAFGLYSGIKSLI